MNYAIIENNVPYSSSPESGQLSQLRYIHKQADKEFYFKLLGCKKKKYRTNIYLKAIA